MLTQQTKQQEQHIPSSQTAQEWTPRLTFHSTKISEPSTVISDPEFKENVDKFIELSSRVVITVSTAWWACCELMDYIKLRTQEREARQKATPDANHTPKGDDFSL